MDASKTEPMNRLIQIVLFCLLSCGCSWGQQVADSTYLPPITAPMYASNMGPVVYIDAGHNNFHTRTGRYRSFAHLLERDGYRVQSYTGLFEQEKLEQCAIMVVSNALHTSNVADWFLPTPSAFTQSEIKTMVAWVKGGGSLFLIADHMPMAGAAEELAKAFGFEFTNGFVLHRQSQGQGHFTLQNGLLQAGTIQQGRNEQERVDQITTFTGQAFKIPKEASSILTFDHNYINLLPDTAWVFDATTKQYPVEGWSQGASLTFGKGRIAVFGEAAMFSAQLAGPNQIKMGMNNPVAAQNHQLLLNLIHWLDHQLD